MSSLKVVLLPGHGGFDSGAVNLLYNIRECDGNLAIALKLKKLLELNGIEVIISRTSDIACGGAINSDQDINNQIKFTNTSNADIAVSIHFNSSINRSAKGVEILYSEYNGLTNKNIKLANLLLEEIVKATGLINRGIKNTEKSIGVLREVNIPIALTECAFISNSKEVIWCSDEEHQLILAKAHCKAICRYFDIEYREGKQVEEWKLNIINKARNLGIITDYHDPDEQCSKWFVLAIAINIVEKYILKK